MDRQADSLIECKTADYAWAIDRLVDSVIDLLTDWLIYWWSDWITGWLNHWLTDKGKHTDWLTDWLTDHWKTDWQTAWQTDWLTDWRTDGLTRQTDWLTKSDFRTECQTLCLMDWLIAFNCSLNWPFDRLVNQIHNYLKLLFSQVKHCEQELDIPGNKASMLFTYMAIASFISRNAFCKLGDFRYFKRFHLYQGGITIYGLCVLCLPLARSFTCLLAIFIALGLMDGALLGQWSLLVFECCGKHKVNQAWGYIIFFTGVSFGIGSPMAGEI